jgi:hypothetical protein
LGKEEAGSFQSFEEAALVEEEAGSKTGSFQEEAGSFPGDERFRTLGEEEAGSFQSFEEEAGSFQSFEEEAGSFQSIQTGGEAGSFHLSSLLALLLESLRWF